MDGEVGDENFRDYPIEGNTELTINNIINNHLLHHEGWEVGRMKSSLTYSGGLSSPYARSDAPSSYCGFESFSPFTRPDVMHVAEGIPFVELTNFNEEKLFRLKGKSFPGGSSL